MKSIPGCTEPKTYGEARSQLEDALRMLAEANSLLLWWRHGKSMTLKQCAHLNDRTDIALGRFGLSEADIDQRLSASAEPSTPITKFVDCRVTRTTAEGIRVIPHVVIEQKEETPR